MQTVQVLCTAFGNFPVPAEMAELRVKWRKRGGWPDMRTKTGKEWVRLFNVVTALKAEEYKETAW